jgi:hypothetical protein
LRRPSAFFALLLCCALPAWGQQMLLSSAELVSFVADERNGGESGASGALPAPAFSTSRPPELPAPPVMLPLLARESPRDSFDWVAASRQSFYFLAIKHGARMTEPKTRRELGGPFFRDWGRSIQGIRGWQDGDGVFKNYFAHPMDGAVTGFIQVQNDPRGIFLEYNEGRDYWNSRLRALAWSAYQTLQFEIGPFSEATIGNVGLNPGTNGLSDFVMTPLGGFSIMLAEDALDRWLARRELSMPSPARRRLFRTLLNPNRGFANMMRGRVPWHRDTRTMEFLGAEPDAR